MRAVVVNTPGPVEALEVAETPDPVPGAGEIAVDVAYAGVGFVDTLFRAGAFDFPTPFVPGIEVTGRVRALGEGVTGFAVGQPVAALLNDFGRAARAGGYAEIAVAHSTMAVPVPEGADLARVTAALVNGVTAWIALHDLARLGVRDDVLVLGATGGLGGTVCRIAAVHPARRVIGVVGGEARRAAAPAACTDVVTADGLTDAVSAITGGRGVDVVVDAVGGDLRTAAFDGLAPFGRLLVLGNASGVDASLSGDAAWLNSRQVIGLNVGGTAHLVPERVATAAAAVVDLVHRGVLAEPAPHVLPLDRAGEAHAALEKRTAPAKTVLAVGTPT
jgi:NADPH2:quinone reductase